MNKPKVVIVGGGYAGSELAQRLDRDFVVTLIERKQRFLHNLAALRAAVRPEILGSILLPYDRLLTNGVVVQDIAKTVHRDRLETQSGQQYAFDFCVIATGSSYVAPGKTAHNDIKSMRADYHALASRIRAAKSVTLVGGGPVGIELAGEIREVYRDKIISLVNAGDKLVAGPYDPRLSQRLEKLLRNHGIELHMGQNVQSVVEDQGRFIHRLSSGKELVSDLSIQCFGSSPVCCDFTSEHFSELFDERKRLKVNQHLQLEKYANIFAMGDVTNVNEPKTAISCKEHTATVAENIRRLVNGQKNLRTYVPKNQQIMVIPFGSRLGVGQLPVGPKALVVGNIATSLIKGRGLFIQRYLSQFGYKNPVE